MSDFTIGQPVCIKGKGMDAMYHKHGRVERFTKTLVIVRDQDGSECRFNSTDPIGALLRSVPYAPYGGHHLSAKCQRPKGKS